MMHRILYSSSRDDDTDENGFSPHFSAIGEDSARRNTAANITGFLICTPTWYAQVLEGERLAVLRLFDLISDDDRHYDVAILDSHPFTKPMFACWAMGWRHQNITNRIKFLERGLVQDQQPHLVHTAALYHLAKVLAQREG